MRWLPRQDPNSFASIAGQTFPAQPMPDGWDVNVTDYWRSTLMANSAHDPFWRAKVRHEVLVNPDHQLGSKINAPRATPMGHLPLTTESRITPWPHCFKIAWRSTA